jgi:hypothetical protein
MEEEKRMTQELKDIPLNSQAVTQQNITLAELSRLIGKEPPLVASAMQAALLDVPFCDKCKRLFTVAEWVGFGSILHECDGPECTAPKQCDDCWDPEELGWGAGHSECYYGCGSKFCNACTDLATVKYKFSERGEPEHKMVCPICQKRLHFAAE